MKKYLKYAMLTMILPLFFLSSCEKDDDPQPPAPTSFETLVGYLETNNLDLDDMLADWIIIASDVNAKGTGDYFIIDLRLEEDFNSGHIPGAINSTLGNIVATAEPATKPILVVCYTGQSAGHGVVALRLTGHIDAKVLKWGMSSWNADFDSWTGNVATQQSANWAAAPGDITSSMEFADTPGFTSSSTDGAAILAERVDFLVSEGFKGIASVDVMANPTNFFINNYWAAADVTTYGNIQTSYRINPWTLKDDNYKNLDATEQIVTYCWTGQTSSMITAYYTVLGYNAVSLKFGVNSIIYDDLAGHKWDVTTQCMNYPYDVTP